MKRALLAILGWVLTAAAFEPVEGEADTLPRFEAGDQRRDLLSRIRIELVEAVRQESLGRMDSLLQEGDRQFGRRLWLRAEERLLLHLMLGQGEPVRLDREMRTVFWGGRDSHSYTRRAIPRFCPEAAGDYAGNLGADYLEYAPDLIDHLQDRYARRRQEILQELASYPDLADFIRLVRCPERSRPNPPGMTRAGILALQGFMDKHPESRFTDDILDRTSIGKSWSGNGWLLGAGPVLTWNDTETRTLIGNGFHGAVFTDCNFPLFKLGFEIQIRPFTPRRPFVLGDTLFGRDAGVNFTRMILSIGHSFRLAPDLFLTPYSGLLISRLDLVANEEKRLDREGYEESTLGIPVGARLDYMWHYDRTSADGVVNGLGMRLSAAWHHGRWEELEPGLGGQGLVLGFRVFYAAFGLARPGKQASEP